jgi:hypothetical protein
MRPITAEKGASLLEWVTIDDVERGIAQVHDSGIPFSGHPRSGRQDWARLASIQALTTGANVAGL